MSEAAYQALQKAREEALDHQQLCAECGQVCRNADHLYAHRLLRHDNEYIVRVWVDLKVKAKTPKDALDVAHNFGINLFTAHRSEVYDVQVPGDIWDHRPSGGDDK